MEIREVKMDRPFHKHPLLLSEWLRNRRARKCKGCRKRFSGGDMVYACEKDCQFYLHEPCAKLPEQIQHFLHPSCPLFLRFSSYSCDSCLKLRSGALTYQCMECHFDMDVKCAEVPSAIATRDGEEEQILHFCHRHPLTLFPVGTESGSPCQVCNLSCASQQIWGCCNKTCNFYVHKPCLERLPQRVLTNLGLEEVSFFMRRCQLRRCMDCQRLIDLGFRSSKNYDRDILCISCCLIRRMEDESGTQVPKVISNFFHPCELRLAFAPFSTCNACLGTGSDFSYICKDCDFVLDPQCARLPEVGNKKKVNQIQHFCHWHPLKLFQDTTDNENLCKFCEKFCFESFYGCSQCYFYIHKPCMESLPQRTSYCLPGQAVVLVPIPSFVCTTCDRECTGLSFYCGKRKCRFCVKCVLWAENVFGDAGKFISVHHWHQLSLCETREDRASCILCQKYCIRWSYNYECNECDLYFHKSCAELPRKLEHPMHPEHQLTLGKEAYKKYCGLCDSQPDSLFNDFGIDLAYGCNKCDFFLDTHCASLSSLEYKGHDHPLYILHNIRGICSACDLVHQESYALRCSERCFSLHLTCGPLPVKIKHKCHVHHLILQDYFVEDNEANEFACHVCEEQRDPRLPVYCCSQGCLMICDVKCVLSEVIPLLRGERGEVEVRTLYPPVACKVICTKETKSVTIHEEARDGNSGTGHVFSFEELVSSFGSSFEELMSSFPGFGSEEEEEEEEEAFTDEGKEPNVYLRNESVTSSSSEEEDEGQRRSPEEEDEGQRRSSEEEDEGQRCSPEEEDEGQSRYENPYSYSWEALSRFMKHFRTPSFQELDKNFLREHDGSVMTGDYALPEVLNAISQEFFGMYKITDDKCNLSYPQKRFLIFTACCVLYQMRITKVVDVRKKTMLQWLGWIRFVEKRGGLDVGFVVEYIRQLWEAHFYMESKQRVDDKSESLREQIEEASADREELKTKLEGAVSRLEGAEARLEKLKLSKKGHDDYRVAEGSRLKGVGKAAKQIKWRSCYDSLVRYSRN